MTPGRKYAEGHPQDAWTEVTTNLLQKFYRQTRLHFIHLLYLFRQEVRKMIYCIEDDANIRDLVVYALNAGGFQAIGFESSYLA